MGSSACRGSFPRPAAAVRQRWSKAGLILGCALIASGLLGYTGALVAHGAEPAVRNGSRALEPSPTNADDPIAWALAQLLVAGSFQDSQKSAVDPASVHPGEDPSLAAGDELTPEADPDPKSLVIGPSAAEPSESGETPELQGESNGDGSVDENDSGSYGEDRYHYAYYRRYSRWSSYGSNDYTWRRGWYARSDEAAATHLMAQAAMAATGSRSIASPAEASAPALPSSAVGGRACPSGDRRWFLRAESSLVASEPATASGLVCLVDALKGAAPSDLALLLRHLVRRIEGGSEPSGPLALLDLEGTLGLWGIPAAPSAPSLARSLEAAGLTETARYAPAIVNAVNGTAEFARLRIAGGELPLRRMRRDQLLRLLDEGRDTAGLITELGLTHDRPKLLDPLERPLPASLVPATVEIEPGADECSGRSGAGQTTQPVARAICVGNASWFGNNGAGRELTSLFELLAPSPLSA